MPIPGLLAGLPLPPIPTPTIPGIGMIPLPPLPIPPAIAGIVIPTTLSEAVQLGLSSFPFPGQFASQDPSTYNVSFPMPFLGTEQPSIPAEPMQEPDGASDSLMQQFVASIRDTDFAMVSKYRVDFHIPEAVFSQYPAAGLDHEELKLLSLHCDSTSLPGFMFDMQPYRIYGPSYQRPVHVSYGDVISFSIMLKQDIRPRRIFEGWMNIIQDPISYCFKYPETYMSSGIVINHVKHRGTDITSNTDYTTYSIRLIDAFPIAIHASPLDFGSRDIQKITVDICYRKWTSSFDNQEPPLTFNDESDFVSDDSSTTVGGDA